MIQAGQMLSEIANFSFAPRKLSTYSKVPMDSTVGSQKNEHTHQETVEYKINVILLPRTSSLMHMISYSGTRSLLLMMKTAGGSSVK